LGSSYTDFRGKGFWSRDSLLEVWLRFLSLNMDKAHAPGWQHDLRDRWLVQSSGYFTGCVDASLDDFLVDQERIDVVLDTAERTIRSLRLCGPFIEVEYLNLLGMGNGWFVANLPIEHAELIADRFGALLRGELTTDRTTSPILPATVRTQAT